MQSVIRRSPGERPLVSAISSTVTTSTSPASVISTVKTVSLVEGSTLRGVWHLSWPLFLNMLVLAAANFVEGWVAGRLGPDTQAAVGLGSQIWFLMMMMTLALAAGTTALVSRYWGAGDIQSARATARQAIVFATLFGIVSTAIGLACCRDVLRVFGASPVLVLQGWQYLQFTILSMTPYTVLWISNSIFRAKGDSKTPMATMVIVTILTIALELFLCLGPVKVGVAGIGMAWIIASSIGVAINFERLRQSELAAALDFGPIIKQGLSKVWLLRFLNIGLPACLQDLSLIGSSFGVFYILTHTQNTLLNQAAWAAGWRVEEVLTIMPIYGLSMAAATVVGQNLGAKKAQRAKVAAWQVTAIGITLTIGVGLLMYFAAVDIARLMSNDPHVIEACAGYLRTVSISEPFFAAWLILSGAMQGAGYTRWPMVSTVCCFNILRLFLAWILSGCFGLGATGVWLAMAVSSLAAGTSMIWQWHRNSWQKQIV